MWSEPLKALSARFGISDVALRKTRHRVDSPRPSRGYWAKRASGKRIFQAPLPERAPGMSDEVVVGGGAHYWFGGFSPDELQPDAPHFPEPIASVLGRIAKTIGKVSVPRQVTIWHPALDKLIKKDDARRGRQQAAEYQHRHPGVPEAAVKLLNRASPFSTTRTNSTKRLRYGYRKFCIVSTSANNEINLLLTLTKNWPKVCSGQTTTVSKFYRVISPCM